MKPGFVYFMSNRKDGVIYIGVTSDPAKRYYEHSHGLCEGFTRRYNCARMVYIEAHATIEDAIAAEKKLKNLPRAKKIAMIHRENPEWLDLGPTLFS